MAVIRLLRAQEAEEGVEPPVEWVVVFCEHPQVPLPHLLSRAKPIPFEQSSLGVANVGDMGPGARGRRCVMHDRIGGRMCVCSRRGGVALQALIAARSRTVD